MQRLLEQSVERAAKSNRITVNRAGRGRLRQDMAALRGGAGQIKRQPTAPQGRISACPGRSRAASPARPHIVLPGGGIRKGLQHGSWRGLGARAFSVSNAALKETEELA